MYHDYRDACGPLCPNGKSMADPDRLVAGQSCSDWNDASMFLPSSYDLYQDGNGGLFRTCSDFYDRIAHGCGCEGVTPPTDGCGSFVSSFYCIDYLYFLHYVLSLNFLDDCSVKMDLQSPNR